MTTGSLRGYRSFVSVRLWRDASGTPAKRYDIRSGVPNMPFVYPKNPQNLVGTSAAGEGEYKGECAAIAQFLVPGLGNAHVSKWRRGAKVKGNLSLRPGT